MSTTTIKQSVQWQADPAHSQIGFRVKHLVIATVSGVFKNYEVNVKTDGEDFTTSTVRIEIDAASVDTGNDQRDNHLRSDDFFNAESFPKFVFESERVEKINDHHFKLFGHLTIRDITKPIQLEVEYGGTIKDPWGKMRAGFGVRGTVNRKEFNLRWNQLTEAGSVVVSDEVWIDCDLQLVKQEQTA